MYEHPNISVLIVDDNGNAQMQSLVSYLKQIPHLQIATFPELPGHLSEQDVVITACKSLSDGEVDRLSVFCADGGGWLNMIDPGIREMPVFFGAQPGPLGPECELRIVFHVKDHPLSIRLPDAIYLREKHHPLILDAEDAEMILYTDWHYRHSAVLVARCHGRGKTACTTLQDFRHPVLCRIFYRLIRYLGRIPLEEKTLGVGILGYAPSVGQLHGQGIFETPGFAFQAVCDLNPERLVQAQTDFSRITVYDGAAALGNDPSIDLVIIATPPNTHAQLTLQMIDAGKHVVCEKPLALHQSETEAMAEAALAKGVHLSCHQNRRWDVDYLAIKQALVEGLIGELFYMETFVGSFSHPCGYWHSDAVISGGQAYDWGGHYIDWIVSLFKDPIEAVIGTRHKRVWHDVTNADQERIQIRFSNGKEAEFMHSDIAAARKPKWYLLGTSGAIIGNWKHVTEYQIDPMHYFYRQDIPDTEMPPDLKVYRRHHSGNITVLKPAMPEREIFGFHRNLADHLLTGEPLVAPLADSMRAVAVLEAASRSMANNGTPEVLHV